jgi:hypothetical protein
MLIRSRKRPHCFLHDSDYAHYFWVGVLDGWYWGPCYLRYAHFVPISCVRFVRWALRWLAQTTGLNMTFDVPF